MIMINRIIQLIVVTPTSSNHGDNNDSNIYSPFYNLEEKISKYLSRIICTHSVPLDSHQPLSYAC